MRPVISRTGLVTTGTTEIENVNLLFYSLRLASSHPIFRLNRRQEKGRPGQHEYLRCHGRIGARSSEDAPRQSAEQECSCPPTKRYLTTANLRRTNHQPKRNRRKQTPPTNRQRPRWARRAHRRPSPASARATRRRVPPAKTLAAYSINSSRSSRRFRKAKWCGEG